MVTDPAGDAQNPTGAPNPPSGAPGNTEQVDITNVAFSADPANLTTTMSLASLPVPPKPDPITGTTDSYYYVAWTSSDGNTYATQTVEPSSGPLEFSYGKFDPSTNQLTTSNSTTGSVTIGTPGIISVNVPLSGIGNPTIPVTGGTPAVHDPYAVTISGEGVVGAGLVFTHPDDRAPDAGYGADWSVCGPTGGSVSGGPEHGPDCAGRGGRDGPLRGHAGSAAPARSAPRSELTSRPGSPRRT